MRPRFGYLFYLLMLFTFLMFNCQKSDAWVDSVYSGFFYPKNYGTISVDSALGVEQGSVPDTVTWNILSVPKHGTLVASYATIMFNDTVQSDYPIGCTYTPLIGFVGTDSFWIRMTTFFSNPPDYQDTLDMLVTVTYNLISCPLIVTNVIPNNPRFFSPDTLWNGNTGQIAPAIKICADGSDATSIEYINKDTAIDVSNIRFRVQSNSLPPNLFDPDLNGNFYTYNDSVSGDSVVFVKLTHPQYLPGPNESRNDTIEVFNYSTGNTIYKIPIAVYRAPILMVHGLWSDQSAFQAMNISLDANYYPPELTRRVDYSGSAGWSFYLNRKVVPNNINTLLTICRNYNYSAGKVDVVGHSMGGLLARYYLQDIAYKNDIHKLITINTPHSGSQGANLLIDTTRIEDKVASLIAEPIVNICMHSSIYSGAVKDLAVNSTAMNFLNFNSATNNIVPSHAIITESQDISSNASLNDGLFYLIFGAVGPVAHMTLLGFINYLFIGETNDLVVAAPSQSGGLPVANTSTVQNQIHIGSPANNAVINEVEYALNSDPNDVNYFCHDGFSRISLSSNYRTTSSGTSSLQLVQGSITINSPSRNQSFNPGDLIPINISSSDGIKRIILEAINLPSNSTLFDTALSNETINFTVPNNAFGPFEFIALGYDPNNLIGYDTMKININQTASLDSISLYGDTIYVEKNNSASVPVTAYFHNGYNYDVSLFSGVQYQIGDTTNAKYDSLNLIQGKNIGTALLNVTYLNRTKNIPIAVFAEDTSINDIKKDTLIEVELGDICVYPNPSNGNVKISFISDNLGTYKFEVINLLGQKVFEENLNVLIGQSIFTMPLSYLPKGLYFIKVTGTQKYKVKRFIKDR